MADAVRTVSAGDIVGGWMGLVLCKHIIVLALALAAATAALVAMMHLAGWLAERYAPFAGLPTRTWAQRWLLGLLVRALVGIVAFALVLAAMVLAAWATALLVEDVALAACLADMRAPRAQRAEGL